MGCWQLGRASPTPHPTCHPRRLLPSRRPPRRWRDQSAKNYTKAHRASAAPSLLPPACSLENQRGSRSRLHPHSPLSPPPKHGCHLDQADKDVIPTLQTLTRLRTEIERTGARFHCGLEVRPLGQSCAPRGPILPKCVPTKAA